jgi:glycosyltransferase involved in cell wall biosynthesis
LKSSTKISAIIPTLNEELHIKDAIESVSFADEILVIDSFSSDKTVEIAKSLNAKVIQRGFDDFSSQKNYALSKATYDWIYILDADERVTSELKQEILGKVESPNGFVGFYVYRNFYFLGKRLKYGGWQRDKVIRLFKKDTCKYDGKLVHEKIVADGKVGYFTNKLEHYSYRNYDHYIAKINQYAQLKAKNLYISGKRVTIFHLLIKPPVRFCIHYFLRLGFLDGFQGFVMASIQAYGVLARYINYWILKNKK